MDFPIRDLIAQPLRVAEFETAADTIYQALKPSPQINWPLLSARCGCEVWVKHENHLPTGAFKVRGGLWFVHQLSSGGHVKRGVIATTRGNHGQSIALAAARNGVRAVVVVPKGNNRDKNDAMRALGAELIELGDDFDSARVHSARIAAERGLYPLPSFHASLVQGVGTYAWEFFREVSELDVIYAPVGLGSGLAGLLAARNALGLNTELVGVVAEKADAYASSFEGDDLVSTVSADTLADGLAVRVPSAEALAYLRTGISRFVRVSEDAILAAINVYLSDTHNLAEGAGAAPLAALLAERERHVGKRVGVVLSGGNLERDMLRRAIEHSI